MKAHRDEWGHDPTVQRVRKLFGLMESKQGQLLEQIQVAATNPKLGPARETALAYYETACGKAAAKGLGWDESTYAAIYIHCLIRALTEQNIRVPDDILAAYPSPTDIIREIQP